MMARKKSRKIFHVPALHFPELTISDNHRRVVHAIVSVTVGIIIVLSFFEFGGLIGNWLNSAAIFLLGSAKWALVAACLIWALLLIKPINQESGIYGVRFVGMMFFLVAVLGIIDILSPQSAGELGKAIGSIQYLFGFWASFVIFISLCIIGLVLDFWLLMQSWVSQYRARKSAEAESSVLKKKPLPEIPVTVSEPERPEPEPVPARREPKPIKEESFHARMKSFSGWQFPSLDLLEADGAKPSSGDIKVLTQIIQRTLEDFGIPVEMGDVNVGPTVTQYTLKPAQGVKLARILALQNDLALALAAHPIRIEAPIPGKSLVGIEVPNRVFALVRLRVLLEHEGYRSDSKPLLFTLGRDVMGSPVYADLAKLPHLLVAGATGSGKSIFIHTMLVSMLYRNPPQFLRFILIDPKRVELTAYDGIPYLLSPVITEGKKAILALKWAVSEMERRYNVLLEAKSRDIGSYNLKMGNDPNKILPNIVIFIDELADLMAVYGQELEGIIIRLSQMARATGIHLVVSTQRPSVEVITGLIKANITSRIAFQVASQIDSRTILDCAGSEKLLGHGDLLFISADTSKPRRVQGPFVSEKEVESVVEAVKSIAQKFMTDESWNDHELEEMMTENPNQDEAPWLMDGEDELYNEAYHIIVEARKASASLLQRRLRIGYARAARLLDLLESRGVIGPGQGAKPREVYHTDFNQDKISPTLPPSDEDGNAIE